MGWLLDGLRDIWDKFTQTVLGWYEGILDWFEWALNTLFNWFWGVIDFCIGLVWDFCVYVYDLFLGEEGFFWYATDVVIGICEWFLEMLPDIGQLLARYAGDTEFVMGLVGRLDQFLPVTESGTLLLIYISFMGAFLLVKAILKIFPWSVG